MKRPLLNGLVTIGLCWAGAAPAAVDYKIVTASERGTYIQIGRDLAKHIAPAADINLQALPSAGSAENVKRLRYEAGVKLALVQSDVYQAFLDLAAANNKSAAAMIRPLRVIMPLYNEEIYFVVRADSPLKHVHEIRNARINAGPVGSGTALTTSTLYRLMFNQGLPDDRTAYMSNEEALVKLLDDKSVDVVAVIAGQPAKLLADMKPEARQHIRLLRFDPDAAASKAALKTYFPATVRAASYPNLLTEDLPALAVKALLVTYDFNTEHTRNALAGFTQSLCRNFPTLQANGHPKWREVELAMPELGRGWFYYKPAAKELSACIASNAAPASANAASRRVVRNCSKQEEILGLCQ